MPTYPSIQDVTELPQQASSYGSLPTPVGGVTSNVLGPYTLSPQLDSIRFDGTGYIDYGNAASSVMTTNIWASNWTIEGWVYIPALISPGTGFVRRALTAASSSFDWDFYLAGSTNAPVFNYGSVYVVSLVNPSTGSWNHMAATYDGANANVYINGTLGRSLAVTPSQMAFNPAYGVQIGADWNGSSFLLLNGNLADVRVSNVARYGGTTYVVPTQPFASNDANTLLLLKSLGGQVGTTLEVQGRGLNAVSLGATRSVQSYPPAPMTSYLLDTTSNASVTYGQGKYVASASGDNGSANQVWTLFDNGSSYWYTGNGSDYGPSSPYLYNGTITTVDVLGSAYKGQWAQIQLPVSVVLSNYTFTGFAPTTNPTIWVILGSRDGSIWTLVDSRNIGTFTVASLTFQTSVTQAYNYFRVVVLATGLSSYLQLSQWTLNGTEESLCITSDAKVGVGIANPQRTMEIAGDLVVSGTISGGAGMGAFRNRIINGDMRIAQRGVSGTMTTGGNGASTYYLTCDRFACYMDGSSTGGILTVTQDTDVPTGQGFLNCYTATTTSAYTFPNFSWMVPFFQRIEGYNVADLRWGTSYGQPVTISFWFKASAAGSYSLNVGVNTGNYWYTAIIQVGTAATWQYYTFTIPPPPNGATTSTGNAVGVYLYIGGAANNNVAGTPASWISTNAYTFPGATNIFVTAGAYIKITGIQLEKGTVASPFEVRPYATELALCQRYFTQLGGQSLYNAFGVGIANQATTANIRCFLPVPMRSPANATAVGVNVGNMVLNGNVAGTWSTTVVTAVGWNYQNINEVGITATVASGLGINWPYILAASNSLAPLIQINNEL